MAFRKYTLLSTASALLGTGLTFTFATPAMADATPECNVNPSFGQTTECGTNSVAGNAGVTAVGNNASGTGLRSTAVGASSESPGRDTVAIGYNATSLGLASTTVGSGSIAEVGGIAIGHLTIAGVERFCCGDICSGDRSGQHRNGYIGKCLSRSLHCSWFN